MTYFSCLLCPIHAVFIYCKCRCYAGCKLWRWNSDVKAGPLLPRNCTLYSYTSQIEMYLYLNMPLNEDVEFFLQKQINLILICTVRNTKNRIISHLCFKVWSGFCLRIVSTVGRFNFDAPYKDSKLLYIWIEFSLLYFNKVYIYTLYDVHVSVSTFYYVLESQNSLHTCYIDWEAWGRISSAAAVTWRGRGRGRGWGRAPRSCCASGPNLNREVCSCSSAGKLPWDITSQSPHSIKQREIEYQFRKKI